MHLRLGSPDSVPPQCEALTEQEAGELRSHWRNDLVCADRERLALASREQVESLADAVDDRYRAAVIVQAALGLRASELLGLQVSDVDFLRRQVKIERQLLRDGKGFGPLKTAKSRRTLPLAAAVVPVLSEHIRKYPPNENGVIFTSTYGNPIRMNRWSAFIFKPAVAKAGLPDGTSSHDLRHHFAAVLLRRGVPVNVVARYLGHASAALVLSTYSRLMPDSDDLVRTTLDSVWCVTDESQTADRNTASST